jgi:xanthine dehydrogenase FAD-binding subunit
VGVSAFVTLDKKNHVFRDVKIALSSSAPVPMRAKKAEAALRGRSCTDDALEEAALAVCEEADPRTSWRATREFRFELLRSLTKRSVRSAHQKASLAIGDAP